MGRVAFHGVSKRFGDTVAVDDLTLEVEDREFLVLLGPSGCGKTTALRMLAGLEEPTSGTIEIGSRIVNGVEPKLRDIAMVFQSYALYPHMSVRKNIEFPLKSRHVPSAERRAMVDEASRAVGLEDLMERKPGQLSGGQRQRVALARAIVRRPQVFLMDEPLSNLDAKLRVQTRAELIELQRRLATTVVYVTHDQVEAMTMGDRIAIMSAGRLQQIAPPQEVYARPANLFVARFIGNPPMNTVAGRVVDAGIELPGGVVPCPPGMLEAMRERGIHEAVIGVRPEHLRIEAEGIVPATVTVIESLGHERHVVCRLVDGQMIIVRQTSDVVPPTEGSTVQLTTDPATLHLFDAQTEERLDLDLVGADGPAAELAGG
jgi:multiple sugar transport system ATP-binding protein